MHVIVSSDDNMEATKTMCKKVKFATEQAVKARGERRFI
jgi:cellulose synthase/poly-beta-1,6-N-acetylglucosamine synthase-like glycosyltransferase